MKDYDFKKDYEFEDDFDNIKLYKTIDNKVRPLIKLWSREGLLFIPDEYIQVESDSKDEINEKILFVEFLLNEYIEAFYTYKEDKKEAVKLLNEILIKIKDMFYDGVLSCTFVFYLAHAYYLLFNELNTSYLKRVVESEDYIINKHLNLVTFNITKKNRKMLKELSKSLSGTSNTNTTGGMFHYSNENKVVHMLFRVNNKNPFDFITSFSKVFKTEVRVTTLKEYGLSSEYRYEEYFKKGDCIITNKSEDSSDCSVPMHIIRRFQHFVDIKDLLITKGNNK